ncbi:permease [Carboxylicivirga sp. RSCT41]|uniref:permease n=1 Tax=Carboxylicivirga agarovorans TaxID=3417570 RepID=UPI003D341B36
MPIKDYILSFFTDFVKILGEMSPYLLLGFFFAGLLYAFIPQKKIERFFSGKPLKSSILASVFGIPLPLCSCGVIPTGAAFYKNGASKGGTVSFLISTPQTGVDSILATFSLMGLPFAIVRPLAALITGVTGGLITSVVTKNETESRTWHEQKQVKKTMQQKVVDVFRYGFVEFIQDISKWLVIGLVLAAIISALIPNDFFELLNLPPIVQMLLILLVSVPLYICATGSIPLAAVLILKGISPGAAFVLLMAGPATNAATITMIGKVLGKKSLLTYLSTIIVGALAFGLIIDYTLPVHWFTGITQQHLGHEHHEGLSWLQIVSGLVLTGLIVNGYYQKYRSAKKQKPVVINQQTASQFTFSPIATKVVRVDGMTCNHCKANVETNLEKLSFVDSAKVNLSEKTVTLEGTKIDMDTVKETINSLGYTCR